MPNPLNSTRPRAARTGFVVGLAVAPLLALVPTLALAAEPTPSPTPTPQPAATPKAPVAFPAGIEDAAAYVAANSCDATAKPGVARFADLLQLTYPRTGSSGIVRHCDARPSISEHTEGRGWDWRVSAADPEQLHQANTLTTWLTAPDDAGRPAANARRVGLMYMIWNSKILTMNRVDEGWRPFACTGVTACHQDHVHFSFSWAGARGVTSFWSGRVAPQDFGPCRAPGQMFARPTAVPNPARCPEPGVRPVTDPVVTALKANPDTLVGSGASGPAVKTIQAALGGTAVDGAFGPNTALHVRTFQLRRKLPVTGAVNRATRSSLLSYVTGGKATLDPAPAPTAAPTPSPAPTPAPTASPPPAAPVPGAEHPVADPVLRELVYSYRHLTLRVGSRGPAVQALQRAVGVTADGQFGPITKAAVVRFQDTHRLPGLGVGLTRRLPVIPGVVDRRTWLALSA